MTETAGELVLDLSGDVPVVVALAVAVQHLRVVRWRDGLFLPKLVLLIGRALAVVARSCPDRSPGT